mmetsp:Transcript_11187/g.28043  ORF Transcript_11187/g.28043 Transcript_11187/m.28043 type:complete len:307 (+) Transcript_11187:895-1815(+)
MSGRHAYHWSQRGSYHRGRAHYPCRRPYGSKSASPSSGTRRKAIHPPTPLRRARLCGCSSQDNWGSRCAAPWREAARLPPRARAPPSRSFPCAGKRGFVPNAGPIPCPSLCFQRPPASNASSPQSSCQAASPNPRALALSSCPSADLRGVGPKGPMGRLLPRLAPPHQPSCLRSSASLDKACPSAPQARRRQPSTRDPTGMPGAARRRPLRRRRCRQHQPGARRCWQPLLLSHRDSSCGAHHGGAQPSRANSTHHPLRPRTRRLRPHPHRSHRLPPTPAHPHPRCPPSRERVEALLQPCSRHSASS